jgi:tRNA (uracil-5-)-methyltransferase
VHEGHGKKELSDQVTPLWRMPYSEQLAFKQDQMMKMMNVFAQETGQVSATLEPIIASSMTEGYRNKCEFTVGKDLEGEVRVGFLLGEFRQGIVEVENARNTLHIHEEAKLLADRLEGIIRATSFAPFDRKTKQGLWRLMLVRVHDNKRMVVIQINKSEEASGLIDMLKETFKDVESLYLQETNACHHGLDQNFTPLHGSLHVEERLGDLKFRISPLSFFQVNIPATIALYDLIKSLASTPNAILLDLCCGTGTIGMYLAHAFERVIGIECDKKAVEDAKYNASLNNITNIEFHAAKLEHCLDTILEGIPKEKEIVVVLDPPRAGAHKSVMKTIRTCTRINRLVYVSCAPEQALHNWISLCNDSSSSDRPPFQLMSARAVDMFPHTKHCELVLLFQRKHHQ